MSDSNTPRTIRERPTRTRTRKVDHSPTRLRTTVYLDPDDIAALNRLQLETLVETGKRPERSELVRQAIKEMVANLETSGHPDA